MFCIWILFNNNKKKKRSTARPSCRHGSWIANLPRLYRKFPIPELRCYQNQILILDPFVCGHPFPAVSFVRVCACFVCSAVGDATELAPVVKAAGGWWGLTHRTNDQFAAPPPARVALVDARSLGNKMFILNDFFTTRQLNFLHIIGTWHSAGELSSFSELLLPGCLYFSAQWMSGQGGEIDRSAGPRHLSYCYVRQFFLGSPLIYIENMMLWWKKCPLLFEITTFKSRNNEIHSKFDSHLLLYRFSGGFWQRPWYLLSEFCVCLWNL